ncbi:MULTISPECIES: hypothetical protein [Arsenicicoccus]|uniref:hypothetical protein n=1 Tax=Arsenicicoccus TaxID=267408 RepID=UPI00257B2AC7|nr:MULTISPECIES: hypothetical protein [Arsenicicoccus]
MDRRLAIAALASSIALVTACSGGSGAATTSTTTSTTASASASASAPASASGSPSGSAPATATASASETETSSGATSTASTPAAAVSLPKGHQWLTVPALGTRLAIPTTWKALDVATLRDQKGTPAYATAAENLGYTEAELTSLVSSGAFAIAVGPNTGETAPNLLIRAIGGGTFEDGDQLTSGTRGETGTLDAQSKPQTAVGPGVRGDYHATVDGTVLHGSQLAVTSQGQQDVIAIGAADAATVKKVMDVVVATYSTAP